MASIKFEIHGHAFENSKNSFKMHLKTHFRNTFKNVKLPLKCI
jgi:hypothetical protein